MKLAALGAALCAGVMVLGLTSCSIGPEESQATSNNDEISTRAEALDTHSVLDETFSSFTRDGTFESHTSATGVDFVLTAYPTKATPRTHEWYPRGNKYFTFTFQAYDLDRALRDPFKTKRKVYLSRVEVSSTAKSESGSGLAPYSLDADPLDITLDPSPLRSKKYGQLITSPKGSLEVRNQIIGDLSDDTTEINLKFRFHVWVQNKAGEPGYTQDIIEEQIPIFIYHSDTPTRVLPAAID